MRNKCEAIILVLRQHPYNMIGQIGFPCEKDANTEFKGRFYCWNHWDDYKDTIGKYDNEAINK